MFILNRQQVKFCQVVSSSTKPQQVSAAIAFNGSFFTKGETFLSSERVKAYKRVQELLEAPQQLVILLEDTAELALYHLNAQVHPAQVREIPTPTQDVSIPVKSKASPSSTGMFDKLRRTLNQQIHISI